MGTWWSNGSEFGVVLVTLGLAFACGGKYAVGTGDGQAGESGAPSDGTGGMVTGGRSGGGSGGTSSSGEGGSVATGGIGGTAAGGSSAGVAGSSAGGGTAEACPQEAGPLPEFTPAEPEVVWDRISRFLYGSKHAPIAGIPETTTDEWVRSAVRVILEGSYSFEMRAPEGLEAFMRTWAFEGDEAADLQFWATAFARPAGNFGEWFSERDDRVSLMSDRSFLVAHPNSTRRGLWMAQRLICNGVPPAPPEVEIPPLEAQPNQTRRETVQANVSNASCAGCHAMFDPLGFSLEHYDALGDYRTTENGQPIDASGTYSDWNVTMEFSSIDDLAPQLGAFCGTHQCVASELLRYALEQAHPGVTPSYDMAEVAYVTKEFRGNFLALAPLVEAVVTTPAFLRE